ncbi:50S ribosomal protein L17 [Candidatus Roizmanbacteria bacterium]|nr:50S ribosomal protein L17 [Candidatus Roizmanbacteria bacterium]
MRHNKSKIKFSQGKDANKMLMRKLAYNFIVNGKIETTEKKAKVLKSYIEKMAEKMKEGTEANKNVLLSAFGNAEFVAKLFEKVGPTIKEIKGGYVRATKLQLRSDAVQAVRLEWAYPVVFAEKVKKEKAQKVSNSEVKTDK